MNNVKTINTKSVVDFTLTRRIEKCYNQFKINI